VCPFHLTRARFCSLSGDTDDDEICLARIPRENLSLSVVGEVAVKAYLPEKAVWDISWYVRIFDGGSLHDTPRSVPFAVDLRSQEQIDAILALRTCNEMAKRCTVELRQTLRSSLPVRRSREAVETRFWTLQRKISKGRSLEKKLVCALKDAEKTTSSELAGLQEITEKMVQVKRDLESEYAVYLKGDTRKQFKAFLANLLESGDGPRWISSVTADVLTDLGGDPNRLFQLLVEGSPKSLLLDGAMLLAASQRSDMFSPKQSNLLKEFGEKLDEQARIETNRLFEDLKQAEKEAQERLSMENQAMPLGTMVKIDGLIAQSDLNGKCAIYMGIDQNRLHLLKLLEDNTEVVLSSSNNFSRWELAKPLLPLTDRSPQVPPQIKVEKVSGPQPQRSDGAENNQLLCTVEKAPNVHPSCSALAGEPQKITESENNLLCTFEEAPNAHPSCAALGGETILPFFQESFFSGWSMSETKAPTSRSSPSGLLLTISQTPLSLPGSETPSSTTVLLSENELTNFLENNQGCLKCSVGEFHRWLESEDITSLNDLAVAIDDEDYLPNMVQNGLKKFMVGALKKSLG